MTVRRRDAGGLTALPPRSDGSGVSLRLRLLLLLLGTAVLLLGIDAVGTTVLGGAYHDALEAERRASDRVEAARHAQVAFKVQVPEWKNVLLRGRDLADRNKYWRQFQEREAEVRRRVQGLVAAHLEPWSEAIARRFLEEHATLSDEYRDGLARYRSLPDRPWLADARVRGIDRLPTKTLDALVAELLAERTARSQEVAERLRWTWGLSLMAVATLLAIALVVLPTALRRWVTEPMGVGIAAARRIADGERKVPLPERAPGEAGDLLRSLSRLQEALARSEAEGQAREGALAEARDAALRAAEARDRFLGIVSHELRTPLNAVLGVLQVLEGEASGPDAGLLREALGGARRLGHVVEDVIAFTDGARGDLSVETEAVEVVDRVRTWVEAHRPHARRRGLTLRMLLGTPVPGRRVLDPRRLRQILDHLLDNAIKFTEAGAVTVHVGARPDGLLLEVADTGPGLPEALLDRGLAPLTVGDASLGRRAEGLGLGLAVVRAILASLDGELEVDTGPTGTRVRVALPAPPAASADRTGEVTRHAS